MFLEDSKDYEEEYEIDILEDENVTYGENTRKSKKGSVKSKQRHSWITFVDTYMHLAITLKAL